MAFFQDKDRIEILNYILEVGKNDPHVIGAALVGSYAINKQDVWSDIDISFGIKEIVKPKIILDKWTNLVKAQFEIIHYFDIASALGIYRVILFSNGIELDLSAIPQSEFGPKASKFKLLFGSAKEKFEIPKPSIEKIYGLSWHHVLHANSALKRNKLWQAQFWLDKLREHIFTLKCLRNNVSCQHGRGIDLLDEDELKNMEKTLVKKIKSTEIKHALKYSARFLCDEIAHTNIKLSKNLSSIFEKAIEKK